MNADRAMKILLRSARPLAVECSERDAKRLAHLGLVTIVARNPNPFVEITKEGRDFLLGVEISNRVKL